MSLNMVLLIKNRGLKVLFYYIIPGVKKICLTDKCLRSYKICHIVKDKDLYILKKLNGLYLASTPESDRLKKFHPSQ